MLRQRRREGTRRGDGRHRQALGGREAYYTRELATDHEQYLSGHGESPGRWYGAGASSLGLHSYHITDPDRALRAQPNELSQRADQQRIRVAIDRVQAKQRAADRRRDTQLTDERTSRPRPGQPRGRPGPLGQVVTDGVPVVSARHLPSMLRRLPVVLGTERVAAVADQARIRFHAAG